MNITGFHRVQVSEKYRFLPQRFNKCKITEGLQQSVSIGEEYCISVNAKTAGDGAVTCRIRSNTGR